MEIVMVKDTTINSQKALLGIFYETGIAYKIYVESFIVNNKLEQIQEYQLRDPYFIFINQIWNPLIYAKNSGSMWLFIKLVKDNLLINTKNLDFFKMQFISTV